MEHKIKVYSTNLCPYCDMLKEFLEEHKIKFENIDVSRDQKSAKEMIEKTGQMGVPVTDIDGKIIIGFNKPELKKALKIK